jgi:hypothetical protein
MTRALSVAEVADLTGLSQSELEERVVRRSLRVLRADGEWMISLDSLARAGLAAGGEDGGPEPADGGGVLARLERLAVALGEQRSHAAEARARETAERRARAAAEAELAEEREHRRQMELEREAALGLARAAEAARRIAESARDEALAQRARSASPPAPAWTARAAPASPRPSGWKPPSWRPGPMVHSAARAAASARERMSVGVRDVPLLGPVRVIPALAALAGAVLALVGLAAVGMPAGGLIVLAGALTALVYLVGTGPRRDD